MLDGTKKYKLLEEWLARKEEDTRTKILYMFGIVLLIT